MRKKYAIQGKELAYSDRGKGDVLVLLHGYLGSLIIFENLSQELSRHFRVISVDLPGHGQSDIISETHTMEDMAERIRYLLDHLSIDKVLLIGHSLGGYVTLAFLSIYPERVAGYILFHSHPFADTPEAVTRRMREITVVRGGKKHIMYPGNIEKMFSPHNLSEMSIEIAMSNKIASEIPEDGIIAILKGMIARTSHKPLLEEGLVPLLWILGIHDQYINYRNVTEALVLPQNGTLATLCNSGHLGFLEEPGRSVSLITEFAFVVFGQSVRA